MTELSKMEILARLSELAHYSGQLEALIILLADEGKLDPVQLRAAQSILDRKPRKALELWGKGDGDG